MTSMLLCPCLCLLSSHIVASCECDLWVYPYPDLVLVYVLEYQTGKRFLLDRLLRVGSFVLHVTFSDFTDHTIQYVLIL